MFEKWYGAIYEFVGMRKRRVLAGAFLLCVMAIGGLFLIDFDSNVEVMLPRHEVVDRNMKFLRGSSIAGKVILSVGLTSRGGSRDDLLAAVDALARSLDRDLFSEVTTGISEGDMSREMDALVAALPLVLGEKDLDRISRSLNRAEVARRLGEGRRRMLKPGGVFASSMIRSDPMGFNSIMFDRLQALSASLGYDVDIRDGHFVSRDGRHAMIVASTTVPVTDAAGAKRLLAHLRARVADLPEGVSADIVCGHAHTVSNEEVMKRDIRLTLGIAAVAFPILFVAVIGDAGAALVFLIPVFAILLALNISYMILGTLSYAVMGMGAVVAGISVDYGIHVYVAARRGRSRAEVRAAVRYVARPVTVGALTTAGIFLAFFFSRIEGYHQMALFSIVSIVIALVCALIVMPHILTGRRGVRPDSGSTTMSRGVRFFGLAEHASPSSTRTVMIWAATTLALGICASRVTFTSSLAAVDGTSAEVLEAEKRFRDVWGEKRLGVVVVEAEDLKTALLLNERIYERAGDVVGADRFASLAALWRSPGTRKRNSERWSAFWSDGREEKLRSLLAEEGGKLGFADDAFEPFFARLRSVPNVSAAMVKHFHARFVDVSGDRYRVLSFFPDNERDLAKVDRVILGYDNVYVVSRMLFERVVAEVIGADMRVMTVLASILVVGLTFIFLRSAKATIIALVPVGTSIVWLLGSLPLLGLKLNIANLIANLVVMGLCVDYGIFMTYRSAHWLRGRGSARHVETGTVAAVTLSAASTLVGAGALLFAKHPALFSIGVTLVIGVSAGYLSSIFVVPRLCRVGEKS